MHGTKRRTLVLICVTALIVGGVVWGCGPPAAEEPTAEPVPSEERPTEQATTPPELPTPTVTPRPQPELQSGDPFFAEYRFIVTGPQAEVDGAVEAVASTMGILVTPTDSLDLWFLEDLANCPGLPRFRGKDLVMVHYRIAGEPGNEHELPRPPQDSLAKQVVDEINKPTAGSSVFADLVWGTANIGDRPWHGGESPWHGGESPSIDFYIEFLGDLVGGQEAFRRQWAFTADEGIRLDTCKDCSPDGVTGEGVLIGVFDTWPDLPPSYLPEAPPLTVEPMADLKSHPVGWNFSPTVQWPVFQYKDHGLYVSGLIHAVAPGSSIVLYPVLRQNGFGDLFTLDYALYSFISDSLENRETLNGAVINLSLGSPVSVPPDSSQATPFEQEVTLWPLLERATSLQTLLSAAVCHDIVVVAAAGNGGGGTDLPAAYPWIISVMASTVDGEAACYSNDGQIAAPGGGLPDPYKCLEGMKTLYDTCAEAESADQQLGDCQQLLMSWVTDSEGSSPTGYRFGYGAGTSFSTPLVSGLAALIQEASWLQQGRGWVSPDLIAARILSTTHHSGVIDISRAVQETLNPQ